MNDAYLGILNIRTISYVGFALLGTLLLVMVAYGLLNLRAGLLLTLATTVVSGAVIIIIAFFIIHSLSNTSVEIMSNITNITDSLPQSISNQNILDNSLRQNNIYINWITLTYDMGNLNIYWEVEGGVGCCESEGCNYTLFEQECVVPFKLYTLYVDGHAMNPPNYNPEEYQYYYNCTDKNINGEPANPWNQDIISNISIGIHQIIIEQTDCTNIVGVETLNILIQENDGIYSLGVI